MGKHRKPSSMRPVIPGVAGATIAVAGLLAGTMTGQSSVQRVSVAEPMHLSLPPLTLAEAALRLPVAPESDVAMPARWPLPKSAADDPPVSPTADAAPTAAAVRHATPVPRSARGLLWPFPAKSESQVGRTDEGLDLVSDPGGPVVAVAPGTVRRPLMADPGGFGNDYAIEHLDAPVIINGHTFNDVYYGHTHALMTGHVDAGQTIARTGGGGLPRGGNGEAGEVEIGFGNPNAVGGISWAWGALMKAALG